MRNDSGVTYIHSDHLGSSSLTTNASGGVVHQARYKPFGEVRWHSGSSPTDLTFTGQRTEYSSNILDFGARFYSPVLGRFLSPDSIIPNSRVPQDFNRYSYGLNNPVKYQDPTGHIACEGCTDRDEALAATGVGLARYLNWKLGRPMHVLIESDFVFNVASAAKLSNAYGSDLPGGRMFFSIPGAGSSGGPGYPDVYYNKGGGVNFINEIKPNTANGVEMGRRQMAEYIDKCQGMCARGNVYTSNTGEPDSRRIRVALPFADSFPVDVSLIRDSGVLAYDIGIDKDRLGAYGIVALSAAIYGMAGQFDKAGHGQTQPRRAYDLPTVLLPQTNPLTVNRTEIPSIGPLPLITR